MSGIIYLFGDNGEQRALVEEPYDSESVLQRLLDDHPSLLAGDQMNPADPRRWLLVEPESTIPTGPEVERSWYVDHLFLDQNAVPTLVEVKRSKDTRARREVVAQMLDYAANTVAHWPMEEIRAQFTANCHARNENPDSVLANFLESREVHDASEFWQTLKSNLAAGRIRMLFVADSISAELRGVVEFLNEQMDPAEVLAVELPRFRDEDYTALVPRLLGQTVETQKRKYSRSEVTAWDANSILKELESRHGSNVSDRTERILEWAHEHATEIEWKSGNDWGGFVPILRHEQTRHPLFKINIAGQIAFQFEHQKKCPPFDGLEEREALLHRIESTLGKDLGEDAISRRPSVSLEDLTIEKIDSLLRCFEWYIDRARQTPQRS